MLSLPTDNTAYPSSRNYPIYTVQRISSDRGIACLLCFGVQINDLIASRLDNAHPLGRYARSQVDQLPTRHNFVSAVHTVKGK